MIRELVKIDGVVVAQKFHRGSISEPYQVIKEPQLENGVLMFWIEIYHKFVHARVGSRMIITLENA